MILVFDLAAGTHVFSKPNKLCSPRNLFLSFDPGTGKLTFLRKCAYTYFYDTPSLPFTIELKDLRVEGFLGT